MIGLLLPPEEVADTAKRKSGEDGIKACDAALNGAEPAKDGGRRIELFYGRAIHKLEAERWDDAIADLRAAEADQPDLVASPAYADSLGQTALFLEAVALAGKKDYAAARSVALTASERTPYDLIFTMLAAPYIPLEPKWDAQTEAYFERVVRLYPEGLFTRSKVKALAGDMPGAAADIMAYHDLQASIPKRATYPAKSLAAVGFMLAGEDAKAAEVIASAREGADADRADADRAALRSVVSEANDFMGIGLRLKAGEVDTARTLFAARSEWEFMPEGFVAELSRRLDAASTAEQRTKMPIRSAQTIIAGDRALVVAGILDTGEKNDDHWRMFRQPITPKAYTRFSKNTWNTAKSKYFEKEPNVDMNATLVFTARDGDGIAAAYAIYLHAALMAKTKGKQHFMLLPNQRALYGHFVRIGDPGEKDIVAPILFDADKVIADLSRFIPKPVPTTRR